MLCIHSSDHDPYVNLAAEEFLLRNTEEEVFMLWQSNPVVVVGKHQNALAEINYKYLRNNGISIARRLTGGGTVFHDRGNINFTFIRNGEPGKLINFEGHLEPVIRFLKKMGIRAYQGPKHEIMVEGKKVSGNAEHIYRNRVLHHGTLLYQANLDMLRESIRPGSGRYLDRAVQSNRSNVMNLAEWLNPAPDIRMFCENLLQEMLVVFTGTLYNPGDNEQLAINKLAMEKYRTWDWVFGWSPDYEYHYEGIAPEAGINIFLNSHRGIITGCRLASAAFPENMLEKAAASLINSPHEEENIRKRLRECGLAGNLDKEDFETIVFSFFG